MKQIEEDDVQQEQAQRADIARIKARCLIGFLDLTQQCNLQPGTISSPAVDDKDK